MFDQYEVSFISHSETSEETITDIVNLKQQFWHYTTEQNLRWMNENINLLDKHVVVYCNNELVAYLNLVFRDVSIGNANQPIIGVGNVCVSQKMHHQGMGQVLMSFANHYIKKQNMTGVLLCKDALVNFYKGTGWDKLEGICRNNGEVINSNILTFNSKTKSNNSIDFLGNLF